LGSGFPGTTSKSAISTTSTGNGWGSGTETASESPTTASGSGPQASDGRLMFAVTGVETAPESLEVHGDPVSAGVEVPLS
jgi:hypothetical protein